VSRKKQGQYLESVLVEDYAAEGKSLCRAEGKVVFVENAIPGDRVDLRLTRNKKDWAEGQVTRFVAYSPDRVEPFCAHFGICGGCQWQMLPYEKQLYYKAKQVQENLRRIGKVELPEILPIIGASRTISYRNKLEYTFSNRRFLLKEELSDPQLSPLQDVAGFHARGIFDKIVDVGTCHLQAEPTNLLRLAVKDWAIAHGASFYDIREQRGWLRNMQVRICTTGEVMVNIVFGQEDERRRALLDHILEKFPGITTLLYTINEKGNDSLSGLTPEVYQGRGFVIERLEDFRFKIGPKSFFQTNSEQACALYKRVRELAGLRGTETVYDLYSGTGSMGLFLSGRARKIIGIEVIGEAVADARENAALNGVSQASFFEGDVTALCQSDFFNREGRPDLILTDPPRAGMHEKLLRKILEMESPRLIYVSCNPATQARDIHILDEKYRVTAIQPVDMFPHTHHIENIVKLEIR
jgi:23S rRNA (uracil1939-C5)-methyltransferase